MALPIGTRFGGGQSGSRTKGQPARCIFCGPGRRCAHRPIRRSSGRHRLSGMRRLVAVISAIVFLDAMLFGALIPLVPGVRRRLRPHQAPGRDCSSVPSGRAPSSAASPAASSPAASGRRTPSSAGSCCSRSRPSGWRSPTRRERVGIARFLQGLSSALTWAGALSWVTVSTPRALRGQLLGTVFGIAVLGAILGPMVGAVAKLVGLRRRLHRDRR